MAIWQIHTSHAHAQGKCILLMHENLLDAWLFIFTDAWEIYWMQRCSFLLMHKKFTGYMAVRVRALYAYMPCTAQTVGQSKIFPRFLANQIAGILRPIL